MDSKTVLGSLLVLCLVLGVQCQGPPRVTGSYKAAGEMVETLEDESALLVQVAFEESFDADTNNAAFRVRILGKNVTFVENFDTNQTFQFNGTDCKLETIEEWIKTKSPPSLLAYEDTNGTVRFSLKQLFALDDKYLKERNVSDTFRGIAVRKWAYEINGKETNGTRRKLAIYAYWSDSSWSTTSDKGSSPIGFRVTKLTYRKGKPGVTLHEQYINVFAFVPDTIDHKLFEPIQGVQCENRTQTLPFPDVKNMKALALHSELLFKDNLEIRYVDTWVDTTNRILRMDMERIKDDVPIFERKARKYQSETIIGPMNVAFRVTYDRGLFKCEVIPFDKFELDVQNLINFNTTAKKWQMDDILFGKNQTDYVYIGRAVKRDIPCHMFQGVRWDWPHPSLNVSSLWEWCFSTNMTNQDDVVKFRNGDYGLINAQVKILESGVDPGMFYPGLKMIHHFYDVRVQDPAVVNPTRFDIAKCFGESEKRKLQFVVDWKITEDNIHLVENATSDSGFLQKWKNAIYQWSSLQPYSLRISQIRAELENKTLYVKFTILGPHKQLPDEVQKTQIAAFDAERNFRNNVAAGKVFVSYLPSKTEKMLKLYVQKQSVNLQLNKTFEPHPEPTSTPTDSTTQKRFTLITEPDKDKTTPDILVPTSSTKGTTGSKTTGDKSGSTPTPGPEHLKRNPTGHSPGTVASVSIAMLLVGISVGATGIFVKSYGVPSCLKR
ncbi:hypothetical protein JTE90_027811 [Oedothorax gibbosus]|uniref:LolA-like domain-containing protein n=1 Tax=Oedothorax gibbosus TaxID=931172 RepID=A0AAV6V6Q1_9ARAC|nr:hypothetical protein JTE90_027811 [Oedothorax gibbosus]